MRFSTRHLLFLVALATLVLSGLGMGGVAVTLRHLSFARQEAAARGQETAGLLIADAQAALRREAGLLARDAALVEGVAKRDWATLVRARRHSRRDGRRHSPGPAPDAIRARESDGAGHGAALADLRG